MKFISPAENINNDSAALDYEAAKQFDKVRVGKNGVYFREGFHITFIPYEYIDRVFIRIHEINGKLCCGSTVFQYFRLVFVHKGKEIAYAMSEDESEMDAALAEIASVSPKTPTGVVK